MMKLTDMRAHLAGVALFVIVAAGVAGHAAAQNVVPAARAALPEAIRQAGVLNVATALQWAPFAYKAENGDAVGLDIGLIKLLAAKLGLQPRFNDLSFPSIIPGVQTGRFDVGVDQIGIHPDRLKVVSLVPYFDSGYALLVRKGTAGIDINDLCGKTLTLTTGSSQTAIADELSGKCVQAGKPAIQKLFYPSSADTYLALANGRGDGFLTARAVGVFISKSNGRLGVAPGTLAGRHEVSGIVVRKDNQALSQALLLALQSAVADGSYAALLQGYGVSDGALTPAQIAAGGL